ncbi:hypothetical protein P691DRAFT_806190, partial [Macrolepiota fuliginosa MF-IS2]
CNDDAVTGCPIGVSVSGLVTGLTSSLSHSPDSWILGVYFVSATPSPSCSLVTLKSVVSCALHQTYKILTSSFLMKLYSWVHDLSGLTDLAELGGISALSRRFYSGTQVTVALGHLHPWVEQALTQPYLWWNGVWNLEVCINKSSTRLLETGCPLNLEEPLLSIALHLTFHYTNFSDH